MEVTEVRIKLMSDPHERLLAFCSITLDHCFVVRDLKIIQGTRGAFVAMPSRKLTDHCGRCHAKNHLRARFCSECGARLDENRAETDHTSTNGNGNGRAKLYADIAHPINSDCRESIQSEIIASYDEEVVRAAQPDYVCTYDDYGEDRVACVSDDESADVAAAADRSHGRNGSNGNGSHVEPSAPAIPPAPAAHRESPETKRRFTTPDERTHRIDPAENPRTAAPHERLPQPHRARAGVGDDGFAEGLV